VDGGKIQTITAMKKFNTERIRQRMREQNEKFPPSKGKLMLSAAPVRILPPPQTDKENYIPVSSNNLNGTTKNNDNISNIRTKKFPHLSISVTMDEAEDEEGNYAAGRTLNESIKVSDDDDDDDDENFSVPSAWAMMEHYQGSSKDRESYDRNSSEKSPRSIKNDRAARSKESPGNYGDKIPTRIHWLEDDDGELIQSSFYTHEETSEIGNPDRMELLSSSANTSDLSTAREEDKHIIFRRDSVTCFSDQAIVPGYSSSPNLLSENNRLGQPTPAKVRQKWVDAEDEDLSTHPGSLLQESMIQSIQLSSNEDSRGAMETSSHLSSDRIQNEKKLSLQFLPFQDLTAAAAESESAGPTSLALATVPDETTTVAQGKIKLKFLQKNDDIYLDRIGELESNLKVQQNNTDQVQDKLKERVVELEQALKVTAATPRGTIIDENPLKTLLDRNQTLVKEVRFADQTCVELSSTITGLEVNNERLQEQVAMLAQEKESQSLDTKEKEDMKSKRILEQEEIINKLRQDVNSASENLRIKAIEDENLQIVIKQAMGSLELNKGYSPGLSLASSIISERDSTASEYSVDTNEFGTASKSLQQQIGELVEKAKMGQQTERGCTEETEKLKGKNEALEMELNQLRVMLQSSSYEISAEDSKIQSENEFLGRQLGNVQEKLDLTQKKLQDECQKSESLQVHLKRGVETYMRLIEPLERRLIEVTQFNPKLKDVADVDEHLFSLEKELVHVKASIAAMKRESEWLLVTPTLNAGMCTDGNQQVELVSMIQATTLRMGKRYKQLETDLDGMVVDFSDRLEKLTGTVSLLRSSLLFEKDSISSVLSNMQEDEMEEEGDDRNDGRQYSTSINLISATIPIQNTPVEDEDEMFMLMEEARSPRAHNLSISSDLLSLDMTLGSIVRTGSVVSSATNLDRFRESLETAMIECKRVKDRSSKLKDQIEAQKTTIETLEQENGRLSLNASRRSEEYSLVQIALVEAKTEIKELRCTVVSIQTEKENFFKQLTEEEGERKIVEDEKERLTKEFVQIRNEKEEFEKRTNELESFVAEIKMELEFSTRSSDEYKRRFEDLQLYQSSKINSIVEQKELESADTHRSLQATLRETSELKRLHQETITKLSYEVESKLKLEAIVNGFKSAQLQAQSDAEDRDFESQFAYEDMRKERAELKCKLSLTVKESSQLKESYSNLKLKMKSQMEEKQERIEKLETEKSDLLSNISQLAEERRNFNRLLQDLGCCQDLSHFNSDEIQNCQFESAMKEIDSWKATIPFISDEITAMHHTTARIPELELQVESINSDVSTRELHETNQMKLAEDQKAQNESLFGLLRQAEQEMERSTSQIKEMSEAMAVMQQRETEASNNNKSLESELKEIKDESEKYVTDKREEFSKVKSLLLEASSTLEKKELQLLELNSQLNFMNSDINDVTSQLRSKENEEHSLKMNLQSCENKNSRLREYIRKLTTKLDDWDVWSERQTRAIDKLQDKNCRLREYIRKLTTKCEAYNHNRVHRKNERSSLHQVHTALEQELKQLSKSLMVVEEN
jgi:predicted nuclease with TOPRIM domain